MQETLENSFAYPIEKFCNDDVSAVHFLQAQYLAQRETHENAISRYLQSEASAFGRGIAQSNLDTRAHEVVLQTKSLETVRYDLVRKVNEIEARKSFELAEYCVAGILSLKTYFHSCTDRLSASNNFIEELKKQQQRGRAQYAEMMVPLNRKRHDISAVLDAMVERVEMASVFLQPEMQQNASEGRESMAELGQMPSTSDRPSLSEGPTGADRSSPPPPQPSGNAFSRIGAFMGGFAAAATKGSVSRRSSGEETGLSISASISGHNSSGNLVALCEECEARMKALDHSELIPFFTANADEEPAGLIKQVT
jgi:hypothetical protein